MPPTELKKHKMIEISTFKFRHLATHIKDQVFQSGSRK